VEHNSRRHPASCFARSASLVWNCNFGTHPYRHSISGRRNRSRKSTSVGGELSFFVVRQFLPWLDKHQALLELYTYLDASDRRWKPFRLSRQLALSWDLTLDLPFLQTVAGSRSLLSARHYR